MAGRIYFVSDVHLGLKVPDPQEREDRFVKFIKSIPREGTLALCLLGDIWDFWYEYRDVVPREGARALSALISLMEDGVRVWFCPGNHDLWSFSFFESLGMERLGQPAFFEAQGVRFCVGHGDALGRTSVGTALITAVFHSRITQALFSCLHPFLAFRFGMGWSESNRRKRSEKKGVYHFRGPSEPLYRYAEELSRTRPVDVFVFGHFHDAYDTVLPSGSRFVLLDSWMPGGMPHAVLENGRITLRRCSECQCL